MKYIKRPLLFIILILPFFTKAQTQTRDNAGLQGSDGAVSGFFETWHPVNYPVGASDWWHLLDIRHSNTSNNFAMQFAGSFYSQELFFRKTANNPSQSWSKVLLETNGNVGVGTSTPSSYFHGGNNKVLEIYNPNTSLNSQSHVILSTGSTLDNSGAGSLSWVSKNSSEFQAMAYIGCSLEGDAATNAAGKLVFATSDGSGPHARMIINKNGDIGIGTITPHERLSVNGKIRAHEIKVETANWPDYVFAKDYKLPSLAETEKHIKEKGHLPGIPSAKEAEANGVDLGEMNAKLLQKIEELTLHLIEVDKKLNVVLNENMLLKSQINKNIK